MTRRQSKNKTGITRVTGKNVHDAWISFECVRCNHTNMLLNGASLAAPEETYENATWQCKKCKFIHNKKSALPFPNWPKMFSKSGATAAKRFWLGFFRIATENPESYRKWCNSCNRILPYNAFSKHAGWGPLERQMECRSCKGGINARLNPKRTAEQLHEGARRRRVADLLLEGENQSISIEDLFKRFDSKCFKSKKSLDPKKRSTWAIDHILPSAALYPLTIENAALLSKSSNNKKRDQWPSKFYSNSELVELCRITGADLSLLASQQPIINKKVDVNACVDRSLRVRERSDLQKRVREIKWLIEKYNLTKRLSRKNKKLLGL